MCESLSDEYRGKAAALLQKYRPIEDDTQMTVAEKLPYIEQWWRQSEQLLKGLCFHYDDIEKSIEKADVKLRYLSEYNRDAEFERGWFLKLYVLLLSFHAIRCRRQMRVQR